jgi:hypothetical protein
LYFGKPVYTAGFYYESSIWPKYNKYFQMKQSVLNNRKRWSTGIAIYQLIGSITMIIFLVSIIMSQEVSAGMIFALIPMSALCLVSLMAGILYFFKGNELRFFTLSKLNFCAQILQFTLPGFIFRFYYGPYLAFGFDGDPSFRLKFETLSANFGFSIGATSGETLVLINCIPLIPLIILRWIERNKTVSPEFETSFADAPQQE